MNRIKIKISGFLNIAVIFLVVGYFAFGNIPLLKYSSQLLFLGVAVIALLQFPKIKKNYYLLWALIFFAYCLFSVIWAVNKDSTLAYSASVFQVILFSILIVVLHDNSFIKTETIENSIVIAGIIMVIIILLNTPISTLGSERFGERVGMHPNTVSNNLLFAEVFSFNIFMKNRGTKKGNLFIAAAVFFLIFNFCTASKKGLLIGVAIPIYIYMLYDRELSKKMKNFLLLCLAIVLFIVILSHYSEVTSEMLRRFNMFTELLSGSSSEDMSTVGRILLYKGAWKVFCDNPIIGVGLDGFRYVNTGSMAGYYAHCNYLELLADLGCVGCFIYYSIYAMIYAKIRYRIKKGNRQCIALQGILIAVLLLDIAQVNYYNEITYVVTAYLYIASSQKQKL